MAQEIQITVNASVNKSGSTAGINKGLSLDLITNNNFGGQIFVASTSGAALPVGSLTTFGGYHGVINNSTTLTCGIYQDGATATVLICTLQPGGVCLFPAAAALGCKAASGAPELFYFCVELEG